MADITYGIDISTSQGEIDWSEVRADGIAFAYVKASEGSNENTNRSDYFRKNVAAAKSAGILVGSYHFFRANQAPESQAALHFAVIKTASVTMDLPPMLDVETDDGMQAKTVTDRAAICLSQLAQDFGRTPLLYTYASFAEDYLDPQAFSAYLFWIASWGGEKIETPGVPPFEADMPEGWDSYALWQFSEDGQVKGIDTNVDLDLYWGSREDLAGLGIPIPWPGYIMDLDFPGNVPEDVVRVQARLGVQQTGQYGRTTLCNVMAFQKSKGIEQNGKVGQQTWTALFNS